MRDFEKAVKHAAETSVLDIISKGSWVAPDYANRFKIPSEFMADIWNLVDAEKLKKEMAKRLEKEMADRIVNHMAAEISTDIKAILSVTERRDALRSIARENMEKILGAKK